MTCMPITFNNRCNISHVTLKALHVESSRQIVTALTNELKSISDAQLSFGVLDVNIGSEFEHTFLIKDYKGKKNVCV